MTMEMEVPPTPTSVPIPYDFSVLKTYLHIAPEDADHLLAEMPATELLYEGRLTEMMRLTGEKTQAIDLTLPASFFGTTLCHLCMVKLYFLAVHEVILDLSLDRLTFQIDYDEDHGHPHLGYKINELATRDIPAPEGESAVRGDWEAFLAESVVPAVETIARMAGMKPEMIWHQFGGLIAYLEDFMRQAQLPEEAIERYEAHVRLLSESIEPERFRQRRNPFKWKVRYVENCYQPGEKWIMRSACCLYDRREGGEKCYVCPRRTEQEREEMKQRLLASAQAE